MRSRSCHFSFGGFDITGAISSCFSPVSARGRGRCRHTGTGRGFGASRLSVRLSVAASCAVPRDTGKSGMLVTSAPAAVTVACPGSRGEAWTHHKCSQKGRAYKKVRRLLCIVTVFILIYIVACLSIFYNETVLLQREIKCFVFKKVLELKKS